MSDKIKRDLSGLKTKIGNLLTPTEIAAQIRAISTENTNPASDEPKPIYRRKYTTMLAPDLIFKLKSTALDKGISAADLLENILRSHFQM
jgi:hypothetical protein